MSSQSGQEAKPELDLTNTLSRKAGKSAESGLLNPTDSSTRSAHKRVSIGGKTTYLVALPQRPTRSRKQQKAESKVDVLRRIDRTTATNSVNFPTGAHACG